MPTHHEPLSIHFNWCSIHDHAFQGAHCGICDQQHGRVHKTLLSYINTGFAALARAAEDYVPDATARPPRTYDHLRPYPHVSDAPGGFTSWTFIGFPILWFVLATMFYHMMDTTADLAWTGAALLVFAVSAYATIIVHRIGRVQQARLVQWKQDARLPHEIAQELRTYFLGRTLVALGVLDDAALEYLSSEARAWLVSFPSMRLATSSDDTIVLGKRTESVLVRDIPWQYLTDEQRSV